MPTLNDYSKLHSLGTVKKGIVQKHANLKKARFPYVIKLSQIDLFHVVILS